MVRVMVRVRLRLRFRVRVSVRVRVMIRTNLMCMHYMKFFGEKFTCFSLQ